MRRLTSLLLCLVLIMCLYGTDARADDGIILLPAFTLEVEESAFEGNAGIKELIVPEHVTSIGSRAFANCTSLRKVTFLGGDVQIAKDAFDGCNGLIFNAYQDSGAELYALSHGYSLDYLGELSPEYQRVMSLVASYSSDGVTQGKESMRVIVRMQGDTLPDISEFDPVSIVRRGSNIFFIQLPDEDRTVACYEALDARNDKIYVEYDDSTSAIDDEASAAGIMSWADDDPMGFDEYSTYVKANQSGSQLIAVVDSGINRNTAYNGILSDKSLNMVDDGQGNFYDGCRHGSLIASVIKDCVGSANVRVMSVRVVNNKNQTTPSLLGMGIAYAAEQGADIINLSLNTGESAYVRDELQMAMRSAKVVVAAGNDNKNTSQVFPVNVPGVIAVSGLSDPETIWRESNTGAAIMYTAPAVGIRTSGFGNIKSGTSFSAPMISAAIALVNLDPSHSISDMTNSCVDLGAAGRDSVFGYGLPQLDKLASLQVVNIEVKNKPTLMHVNDEIVLDYTVEPEKALNRTVSCVSDANDIIEVTRNGEGGITLRAKKSGKARVTISTNDGSGVSVVMDIQVIQTVKQITIKADTDELPMTRTMTLAATIEPAGADNNSIIWKSSNEKIAKVSSSGVVTPMAEGTVTIRAEAADGYGAYDSIDLHVIKLPDPEKVVISSTDGEITEDGMHVKPGDTVQLSAQVYPRDADQEITWSVKASPASAASIDQTGKLTTTSVGSATVQAVARNKVYDLLIVTIVQMPTSVRIEGKSEVNVGSSISLTANVAPTTAYDKEIEWTSSNTAVAIVDQNGTVTGISAGEVKITASSHADRSVKSEKMIEVHQMPQKVEITGETNIFTGNGSQLKASVFPENTSNAKVKWTSSDDSIATVSDSGLVTAMKAGTVNITAVCEADQTVSAAVSVVIKDIWSGWTAWSTTAVTASDDMQVESRTEYRYKDTTYGAWSSWSTWTKTRRTGFDTTTTEERYAQVYPWYYFACSKCGTHNKNYGYACTNCGATVPSSGWDQCLTDHAWSGSTKVSYTDSAWGLLWSWPEASGEWTAGTGYSYRTRTKAIGNWSEWSTTAVTAYATASAIREVETRVVYRFRLRNTFGDSVVSGWVTEDMVPANAEIVNTKWVYTEKTTSTSSSLEGWAQSSGGWKQTQTGSVRWANFSNYPTFDTTNSLYSAYHKTAPAAYTYATSKRTTSSTTDGYIYWHWMYSVNANAYDRVIFYKTGYGNGNVTKKYYYRYFQAYESKTDFKKTDLNDGQDTTLYSWYLNKTDHTSNAESGGSYYWYRIPITKTTYTDYVLEYTYTRTLESATEPENKSLITSITKYVQYRLK